MGISVGRVVAFGVAALLAGSSGAAVAPVSAAAASRLVTGVVTDDAGRPLSGVVVAAQAVGEGGLPAAAGSDSTDALGRYDIAIDTSASIKVLFDPIEQYPTLSREYWDDASYYNQAPVVLFGSNGVAPEIDAVLDESGAITGRITDDLGRPLGSVVVDGHTFDGRFWTTTPSYITDAAGRYVIPGVRKGRYRVLANSDDRVVADTWFAGATTRDEAVDLEVTAGDTTTDIDIALPRVGHITGEVSAADGGLVGAEVTAFRLDGDRWVVDAVGETREDDTFDLPVRPGTIRLRYNSDSDPRARHFYEEFWNNADSFDEAEDIEVAAERTYPGHDAVLVRRSTLSGRVSAQDGPLALPPMTVVLYRQQGDALVEFDRTATLTLGDRYGRWSFDSLEPGQYIVAYHPLPFLFPTTTRVSVAQSIRYEDIDVVLTHRRWTNTRRPAAVGKPQVGKLIQARIGRWAAHDPWRPEPVLRYQWLRDGRAMAGETEAGYYPRRRDIGSRISARILAVGDPQGYLAAVFTTTQTARVAPRQR